MLTLIAAAFTIASVYLSGRKNIWAWPLGLAGAALWVLFALHIGDMGVLLMNGFFVALYIYNFITWKGFTMPTFIGREARIRRLIARTKRDVRRSEETEEAFQRMQPWFESRRSVMMQAQPAPPEHCGDTFGVEPDDRLRPSDFIPCEVCGCTLLFRDAFPVEHVASDFHHFLVGHPAPRHEDVLPFDIKFYCKLHRLPYERVVYVYQHGGANTVGTEFTATVYTEFFKRTPNWVAFREALGAGVGPEWRQVTEQGEQYD